MKLFKATWGTNYGELVALIQAESEEQARELIKGQAWPGYDVEEVVLTDKAEVLFVNGADGH